jgi:hypothetical protein
MHTSSSYSNNSRSMAVTGPLLLVSQPVEITNLSQVLRLWHVGPSGFGFGHGILNRDRDISAYRDAICQTSHLLQLDI